MASMNGILFLVLLLNMLPSYVTGRNNITSSLPLLQGEFLTTQNFELGFFSPNNSSSNQYLGIWYKNIHPQNVIWVANREKPVANVPARLIIDNDGSMKLVDDRNNTYWSTNTSAASSGLFALLQDDGSFVLKHSDGMYFWLSFIYPCDTLIPGTTLWAQSTGTGIVSDEKGQLISWKTDDDPSFGVFYVELALQTPTQIFIFNGSKPYWRSGPWNSSMFVGAPDMDPLILYTDDGKRNSEMYEEVMHLMYNISVFSKMVISPNGSLSFLHWTNDNVWHSSWSIPKSQCDIYGACGPNGICQESEPLACSCLEGFEPLSNEEWSKGNWTRGCTRQAELGCENTRSTKADKFLKKNGVKLPDYSMNLKIEDRTFCHEWCDRNCSCIAYAYVSGIGCLVWFKNLIDIQKLHFGGEDLFIRLAVASLEKDEKKLLKELAIFYTVIVIFCTMIYGFTRYRANRMVARKVDISFDASLQHVKLLSCLKENDTLGLPIFEFRSILVATDNFNMNNQLGKGGFGPVYKGKLQNGKDVAIKRLSSSSGQGIEEFKNEIMLISKLQHRNLVTLIGCCIAMEEMILIYEYMPNKSLDTFLVDPTKRRKLDWAKRFNIIQGVARGLLYLHRDSRLKIIHRDLKVSNILLDEKMEPKISDFGLARMFQGTNYLANTCRVVGTLGYMAPEYALRGVFSEKSDVFSFGVLLLEIVSGRRNTSFCNDDQHLCIISYAWKLWYESSGLNLIDEALSDTYSSSEVMRCIQIALLCVQDQAVERPTMAAVVSMLNSKETLPQPKEPVFMFQSALENNCKREEILLCSANEVTQSPIEGR